MKTKKYVLITAILLSLTGCKERNSNSESTYSGEISSSSTDSNSKAESGESSINLHTHSYESGPTVLKEATLLEKGLRKYDCDTCNYTFQEEYYDLDELVFFDETFQYDGKKHELKIKGILPKGVYVSYENNSLTDIGSTIAKAILKNESNEIIETREATINIVEYTGFPEIRVNTNNKPINSKEDYTKGTLILTNCEEEYEIDEDEVGIRLRGNGTLNAEKKPYRIKFDSKHSLLGLNDGKKAKSWVLLAEFFDYSMLRNKTAFNIGDSLFNYSNNYSSSSTHINLYLNGAYNGVYLLAEQQQVDKNRVNIYEPEENETEERIGYLLELDQYAADEGDFFTVGAGNYSLKGITLPSRDYSIKSDYYSSNQVNFISKYMNNVYKIAYDAIANHVYKTLDDNNNIVSSNYKNEYDTLNAIIDIESFIKIYYLQEIMKNVDVGFSSFYMYVDFSLSSTHPKLTFGAPWDFDWSSGNINDPIFGGYEGTYNNKDFGRINPWLYMISQASFFNNLFKQYYELFTYSEIVENAINYNDYITRCFSSEFAKNYEKWNILGTSQHGYHPNEVLGYRTHADAANSLNNWLRNRMGSLDSIYLD